MSEYGIEFADWCEFPPETMVGETVFDGEGNVIGWIANATVGRETLTAEQVRECVKGVYFEGYSDGATHRAHGIEDVDWQTITDKLNATLGAETCYPVPIYSFDGEFTEYDCDACSECGTEWDGDMPNFCPNCGRRVMEADE